MEEVTYISDDHAKVCGMMHLLISGHFESKDHLYQTLKDVYSNFTLIRKAVFAVLDEMDVKFPGEEVVRRVSTEASITFFRCSLKRILEEDGITIRDSLARLLAEIELYLVEIVKYCIHLLSLGDESNFPRPYPNFYWMVMPEIAVFYNDNSSICCHLINYDTVLEFLDQVNEELGSDFKYKHYLYTVRSYFVLLIKGGIHGSDLEKLLFAVENAVYEMARTSFFEIALPYDIVDPFLSKPCVGILRVLVLSSGGSNSGPLMSFEHLFNYLQVVKEIYLELIEDGAIDQIGTVRDLTEGLSFLMCLFITFVDRHDSGYETEETVEHESKHEQLSNIRLDLQILARNVGSVICSCFDKPEIEETSFGFIDLVEKFDAIKGEIIKTICFTVLEEAEQESPRQDQLGFLILLLQNLKEFMDRKPGLIVTWKDQENLVIFIFYLIQNKIRGDNRIGDDEFSRNSLQIDVDLINHDEMNSVLISAQVVAFKMACNSMLTRYGRLRCWELYRHMHVGSRHSTLVYPHMHVGVLQALVFSLDDTSTHPLSDDLLIAFVECVQKSLIELPKYMCSVSLKEQTDILRTGLSFLVHLLISYRDEEKLLHVKVYYQDLLRNVGSAICSCFSDSSKGTIGSGERIEISDLVATLNQIRFKTEGYLNPLILNKIGRESPKTDQLGSLNILLENWKGLMECESNLITTWKDQFEMIYKNLDLCKSFIMTTSNGDGELQNLCSTITDAGYVAEYLLTTFTAGSFPVWCTSIWVLELMEHVELIKKSVMEVNKKKDNVKEIGTAFKDTGHFSSQALPVPTLPDLVVGFDEEMKQIKEQLSSDFKQLDVISIIGMPGLGKTTLARKVYEDRFIVAHFEVCAWCSVSQEYNKKELFLTILSSKIEITDEIKGKNEIQLSTMVHQQLMGRRYLIVLDDIWSIDAFNELSLFFPDNNQGSRIMLTSRIKVTGSKAKHLSDPIEPGMLTDEESWQLIERKVYHDGKCPLELRQIGMEIARKCGGLPLAVVVVAGILAKSVEKLEFWKEVAGNLSSYRDSQSHVMATLELSYKYLPDCLKPMFLYLGVFPEDEEISADRLMQLWMAEGFVQKMESLCLESEAEKNLMDLVDRSLVMVAKWRCDGSVKSCRVHDLLRDMCLAKAKEEKFMEQVHVNSEIPYPNMYQRRLNIFLERNDETTSRHFAAYTTLQKFSIAPPVHSLLFSPAGPESDHFPLRNHQGLGQVISSLKLLKVFAAEIFEFTQHDLDLDTGLTTLVHLRYVSFRGSFTYIPFSIFRLRNLETLIINETLYWQSITVPDTIWELSNLRHLHINPAAYFCVAPENPLILKNLQTLSKPFVYLGEEEELFRKVPCLKKLDMAFIEDDFSIFHYRTPHPFPNMKSLGNLESLKVIYHGQERFKGDINLPSTLKKLSINLFRLNWSQITFFKELPNLEVLKLKTNSAWDRSWNMGDDDVFKNLKFLKLQDLSIHEWNASAHNFPSLEKLVIEKCRYLKKIPSDLGDFYSLQKIEVISCSNSSVKLIKEIQEEQEESENDMLKFYINQPPEDDDSYEAFLTRISE